MSPVADRFGARSSGKQPSRAGALDRHRVVGVEEGASVEGETPAADACPEVVADALEIVDLLREYVEPTCCHTRPVGFLRCSLRRKFIESTLDVGEWNTCPLRGSDERKTTQDVAWVTALVSCRAHAEDQALALVEVQRRDADPTACGNLADGELIGGLQAGSSHNDILLDLNFG